ncbi:MAG: AsmA family protein [Deltaproteobacteria bacterium]|nr:AsmA family protein [Deltaproteobacteria bacterium]
MKKAIKWLLIVVGGIIVLIVLAILVIPMFVDLQEYKPRVEKIVSEATGCPFTIGGDIDLSLFPWAGFSTSDIHMGNPKGFKEKDLASIESIEVRVKLMPLISKDIQIKRFVVEGPRINIEKSKSGKTNLESLGKSSGDVSKKTRAEKEKAAETKPSGGLPIKALAVGEFAVTKGSLLWIDHGTGERKEITDVTIRLQDVSLDRAIKLFLAAKLDGKPVEIKGDLGPVGKEPGKGAIPIDFQIKALEELEMGLKGKVVDPVTNKQFDLAVKVSPFSPRSLVKALGQEVPLKTADASVLNKVAFKAGVKGDPKNVSISDGVLELDDSVMKFSAMAKDFSRPNLAFNFELDKIDLDRYLPPPEGKKPDEDKKKAPPAEKKKIDYKPLRKLILAGTLKAGEVKARGAKIQDLNMKVSAKNGVFNLDPLALRLYEGNVSSKGTFDARKDTPEMKMALQVDKVQVNPLLQDFMKKDFLEGTVKAAVNVSMSGDDPEKIKRTLNGKGDITFNDGAIVGIDLAGMVRNVTAKFGLAEKSAERPRTDFSELHSPFTIDQGVVDTRETTLSSPLLRVLAAGKANLVDESLDFRVEPKFVATLKGQGDEKDRAGLTVPVLVTGSFSSPKFRPDLKGMLKGTLEKGIPDPSELKKMLPGQTSETGTPAPTEEKAKDLLKGFLNR